MIPEVIIAALLVGWILKGKILRLADVRINYIWLIFVVLVLAVGVSMLSYKRIIGYPSPVYSVVKIVEFVLLIWVAIANMRISGVKLMLAGLVANLAAIVANAGMMPVSGPGVAKIAGKHLAELQAMFPYAKNIFIDNSTKLVCLCDIFPAYRPYVIFQQVYSLGDIITSVGGFIAIIAIMRNPLLSEAKPAVEEA